ncbi:phage portal protein [Pseudazoarcus pumilus]|nr:phage portal protein [Pseudazoarcus pumilus]
MASHAGASDDLAMYDWNPVAASADADLLPDLESLIGRSRDLARNNGLMASGMQTMRDNIVGAVLKLSASPDYRLLGWDREQAREWGNITEAKFRSWAERPDECDAARTLNLLGIAVRGLSDAMLNGDGLGLPLWVPRAGARWNTRIMLVESDRLSTPIGMESRENIRGGIEFDQFGAPTHYHVLKRHPGDALMGLAGVIAGSRVMEWDRIPAFTPWGRRRVIHLHDKERTGQSRGKPIVAAVMREFKMAGDYASNELKASVANSLVAAFLESDLGESAGVLFGEDPRGAWAESVKQTKRMRKLEGAAVIPLPAGARLSSFTPSRPNAAFEAFMLASLRHIAAGLNIPYELLVKDFSQTNYSSARAALLEAWRYFNGRRRWLVDYWLRPIYELWLEEAVNAGEIDAPGFYDNRYAYSRCRFIFGGRGWVDPVKEAQASVLRMAAGLSTLEQECAEQGLDYEDVLDQRAVEQRLRAERGLSTEQPDATRRSGLARRDADQANDDTDDEDESGARSTRAYQDTLAMLGQEDPAA